MTNISSLFFIIDLSFVARGIHGPIGRLYTTTGHRTDGEIAASLVGFHTNMIWSMPCAEASIVASATTAPSRETSTDACPFASIHARVAPVQKCEAAPAMNYAART